MLTWVDLGEGRGCGSLVSSRAPREETQSPRRQLREAGPLGLGMRPRPWEQINAATTGVGGKSRAWAPDSGMSSAASLSSLSPSDGSAKRASHKQGLHLGFPHAEMAGNEFVLYKVRRLQHSVITAQDAPSSLDFLFKKVLKNGIFFLLVSHCYSSSIFMTNFYLLDLSNEL